MTVAALALFAAYLVFGFAIRTFLQWRATGDSGFRGISGRPGTADWWAGVLFVIALVAGLLGPMTALIGLEALSVLDREWIQFPALVVAVAGIVATLLTQGAMGASWRIGVDASERTTLVTGGPFALVRNPIFSAMAASGAGLAFLVPNVVALAGLLVLVLALELQVRVVEEPYLLAVHGSQYAGYAATVGRFVPGVGRTTTTATRIE